MQEVLHKGTCTAIVVNEHVEEVGVLVHVHGLDGAHVGVLKGADVITAFGEVLKQVHAGTMNCMREGRHLFNKESTRKMQQESIYIF